MTATTLLQQQALRRRHRRFVSDTPPVLQTGAWQCSAASTAWVLRSLGFDYSQDDVVGLLRAMSPAAISEQNGLSNADGSALVALLRGLGLEANNAWLSYEDALAMAGNKPLAMGGATFYHWVAVRGRTGEVLRLANPDQTNYHAVGQTLDRQQFASLGRFAGVWVEV